MSRLVPEKRTDRNGRQVTRHVRSAPKPTSISAPPQPTVQPGSHVAQRPYKPTAKQLATNTYPMKATVFSPDSRLHTSTDEADRARDKALHYVFDANMVEIYEVVGACTRSADAIKLLSLGIRYHGEAHDYLHLHGCDDLIAERSALARAALERGLDPFDGLVYLDSYADPGIDPYAAVDAARFATTSIYDLDGAGKIALDIAEGLTSFDDVKAIGIGRLKATGNLPAMREILRRLHADPPEFTVAGIREILDRAKQSRMTHWDYKSLADMLVHGGEARTLDVRGVKLLCDLHRVYQMTYAPENDRRLSPEEAVEHALYHEAVGLGTRDADIEAVTTVFEAGVPAEVAREVLASGGDGHAAIAVHEGVAPGLAGGWI